MSISDGGELPAVRVQSELQSTTRLQNRDDIDIQMDKIQSLDMLV